MKISKQSLVAIVSAVDSALERKGTLPALSWISLACDSGKLTTTATNFESQMSASIDVDVNESFSICVDGMKLRDVVKALPDGDINFKITDKKLTISKGRSRFNLNLNNPEDFPFMRKPDAETKTMTIDASDLKLGLSRVIKSAAMNDVRYYLNGVYFDFKNEFKLVATDGHRLSIFTLGVKSDLVPLILQRKAVDSLMKMIGPGDVKITGSNNSLTFEQGGVTLTSKSIEANYPNYMGVVPKGGDDISFDNRLLASSIKRVLSIADSKQKVVKVSISDHLIELVAKNADQEESTDEIECKFSGKAKEIGFDGSYLLDAIDGLDGFSTGLITGENSGNIIRQADREIQVVMPMRL